MLQRPSTSRRLFLLCAIAGAAGSAFADAALFTRYGVLQAGPDLQSGRGRLVFENRTVFTASSTASAYRLIPVPPQGAQEFVIMEEQLPDANCAYRYTLIRITPERRTTVTPAFGECTRLSGIRPSPQGVELTAQASDLRQQVYSWSGSGPVRRSTPPR